MNKSSKSVSRNGSRRRSDASNIGSRPQLLTPTIDINECSSESSNHSYFQYSSIVDFESTL